MTLALTPDPEDKKAMQQVVKLLVAVLGGGLGTALGGPLAAAIAAGVVEGSNQVLGALERRSREELTSNAQTAIAVAQDVSGLSEAQLADRLSRDPEVCRLAVAALEAAAEAAVHEKVRLMGHVLANAATDTAVVDEEMLIVRAVRLLDAAHFRVLALLREPPVFDAAADDQTTMRWTPQMLAVRLGWPQRSVTSVLLTLQGVAAAYMERSVIDAGGADYRELMRAREPHQLRDMYCEITDFGAHLVKRVSQAARDD